MTRVAVVSPHLDDAVLSLGAFIHNLSRRGVEIAIVTVLAGDPDARTDAGPWDQQCGFRTLGAAARARRAEDERACHVLGASPVWLSYNDEQYDRGADDPTIAADLCVALGEPDVVLVPGYPLKHDDHAWLTRLVQLSDVVDPARTGFYVEQPYAAALATGRNSAKAPHQQPAWSHATMRPADAVAKMRAVAAYRSQHCMLGASWRRKLFAYELRRRGETVAWPPGGGVGELASIARQTFGVVVANEVLYMFNDLAVALTKIDDVLRDDGFLLTSNYVHGRSGELRRALDRSFDFVDAVHIVNPANPAAPRGWDIASHRKRQ